MADHKLTVARRTFLLGGTLAGAASAAVLHDGELGAPSETIAGAVPWQEGAADAPPGVDGDDFRFFTPDERAFIEAAVDRLIPKSSVGPSGTDANVPFFLDRQLAGPFGRGAHYYLGGPWKKGAPEQGYQLRFSPAELYRAAIRVVDQYASAHFGGRFAALSAARQDQILEGLEQGEIALGEGVEPKPFFDMLLQNTKEGYFSDPIYGGNKDMAAWKMIGFPGAHYDYSNWVTRHGERVPYPTVGFKGRSGWREV